MLSKSFITDNIQRFNLNIKNQHLGAIFPYISEIYCFLRHGCSPDDFFRYEFFKKSDWERRKFITYRKSKHIIQKHNKKECFPCFEDKVLFNKKFKDFINRDWIAPESISEKLLTDFLNQKKHVLLKPRFGGQGIGIRKVSEITDLPLNINQYIIEEILIQHSEMAMLHPYSVNTLRLLTFKGHIIAAAVRIGNNRSIVDNLHSNGICGHIDLDNGIIDCPCIDNQYNHYTHHPSSGIQLIGFQIPLWEIVKSAVVSAAAVIPEVQYVGWDVAILSDSVAIIEGNHDPGHDVVQMIAQNGLYEDILSLSRK